MTQIVEGTSPAMTVAKLPLVLRMRENLAHCCRFRLALLDRFTYCSVAYKGVVYGDTRGQYESQNGTTLDRGAHDTGVGPIRGSTVEPVYNGNVEGAGTAGSGIPEHPAQYSARALPEFRNSSDDFR